MNDLLVALVALVHIALPWAAWRWVRKQQEREAQQAAEDRGWRLL